MRERLMRLLCSVKCEGADRLEGGCPRRVGDECTNINKLDMCMIGTIADHLLANGVIVPPCKVGDTVFMITPGGKIYETVVIGIRISGNIETRMSFLCPCALVLYDTDIGKTVFLTREEAEQALKGGEHHG